ncbi:MAG: IclR family transcriptional regulator [Lautropia sp.]
MSRSDAPEGDAPESSGGGFDRYNVPALERGLRVLSEFSRDNPTLTAPELARRFDLPRSTVFRLLATLESLGFIERTEGGRAYKLGLAVLRLGFEYLASLELTDLGRPLLERLSTDLRVPCNLVVRDGRSIVYVAKVAPPARLTGSVTVGTRLPAHATVFGRVLLADLTLPALRALYPEPQLEAFTAQTPRTAKALFDLIKDDRARGYVAGEGFFESNISTVAAPVRDDSGKVIAALGVTIAASRIDRTSRAATIAGVREAAHALSALLNHAPDEGLRNVVPLRAQREQR